MYIAKENLFFMRGTLAHSGEPAKIYIIAVTRMKASSKNGPNIKLAMVNIVLLLMVKFPPLPLSGRGAYFYIPKSAILLVSSS